MSIQTFDFRRAIYTHSAHLPDQLPDDAGAEVAFAGRSNVGKSSAINAIAGQQGLARTSKTPGRTRQINFFDLDSAFRLVDLPGYGYAKAPEDLRAHWGRFITRYVTERQSLQGMVIPMDVRRPLTTLDTSMLELCWQSGLAVHILLTKSDKLGRGKAGAALQSVKYSLADQPRTTVQLFSALKKTGVDEARQKISALLLEGVATDNEAVLPTSAESR